MSSLEFYHWLNSSGRTVAWKKQKWIPRISRGGVKGEKGQSVNNCLNQMNAVHHTLFLYDSWSIWIFSNLHLLLENVLLPFRFFQQFPITGINVTCHFSLTFLDISG
jgi:hypothetical protein